MPAHPHAELMALYAKDATETDEPWKLWEWFNVPANSWVLCKRNPTWIKGQKYRRKPERPSYRVGLLKSFDKHYYTCLAYSSTETSWENKLGFVKWLTDRVYYDVE